MCKLAVSLFDFKQTYADVLQRYTKIMRRFTLVYAEV